ncbi:MAG: hypothetical protein R2710_05200 [Acidimicrobiales bacterium]
MGEAFAIGNSRLKGISVRLAVRIHNSTFAHRVTLHDYENGHEFTPLTEAGPDGTEFWV